MDIGKRILDLCNAFDITVNGLADKTGVPQSTIQKITSGESATAQVITIEKICEGLEISLEDFFRERDELPLQALQDFNKYKEFLRWKYKTEK